MCPECGEETESGMACAKCGMGAVPPKAVEIEYKDFKISELLDIKMSRNASPRKPARNRGPAMAEAGARENALPVWQRTSRARAFKVVTGVIVVLALIAGFYLLKAVVGF